MYVVLISACIWWTYEAPDNTGEVNIGQYTGDRKLTAF